MDVIKQALTEVCAVLVLLIVIEYEVYIGTSSSSLFTIFCQLFQSRAKWLSSCRFAQHRPSTVCVVHLPRKLSLVSCRWTYGKCSKSFLSIIICNNQSIFGSIKTHLYSAIFANETEAYK